jgi:hypothetical protein
MVNQYDVGDIVRLTGVFTDTGGVPGNPSKVTFWVQSPSSTVQVATSTGIVDNPSSGTFTLDVPVNSSGLWAYRVYSTGILTASEQATFIGRRQFVPSTGTT